MLSRRVINTQIVRWWLSKWHDDSRNMNFSQKTRCQPVDLFGPNIERHALDAKISHIQDLIIDDGGSFDSTFHDRPLILAPLWYDGIKEAIWPLDAFDASGCSSRLVILGGPGSGKTTFVRYLALSMLLSLLNDHVQQFPHLPQPSWPHPSLIPVYIELRSLVSWEGFPKLDQPVTLEHFTDYLRYSLGNDHDEYFEALLNSLQSGQGLIILDGLDEVPIPHGREATSNRRRQMKELAQCLDQIYPDSRIVFTSRTTGYQGWRLDQYASVFLRPLDVRQMRDLATKLYQAKGMEITDARASAESLLYALRDTPSTLKDYPLFLTLMATLFVNSEYDGIKRLPTRKGELYHQSILLLLERWSESRLDEPSLIDQISCTIDELLERLEIVAYSTQARVGSRGPQTPEIDLGLILKELFHLEGEVNPHKVLAYLSQQAGVLISPEPKVYRFAHRTFQEYLAASHIARQGNFILAKHHIENQPDIWREPCSLVAEALIEQEKTSDLDSFLETLLVDSSDSTDKLNSNRCWSIWLAAHIFREHK